jgi:hypothetical protein
LSSDIDEDDNEIDNNKQIRIKLINDSELVMHDVRDELCSLSYILNKLHVFRTEQPDRYRTSYINLSLPGLLEPLILLDILSINIFSTKNNSIDDNYDICSRTWFKSIQGYALSSTDSDIDSDTYLLVKVI